MNCILEHFQIEIVIKHSRFIAEVFPVQTQTQARELLKEQKQKYFDSTHVVHAFVIGKNCEVLGMSDDGEPSGTAGRPVLDVLKGSGCTNIMLTVTRYFGGTLLGTGGLVKAYSDSAKAVLEITKFEPLIEKTEFKFSWLILTFVDHFAPSNDSNKLSVVAISTSKLDTATLLIPMNHA